MGMVRFIAVFALWFWLSASCPGQFEKRHDFGGAADGYYPYGDLIVSGSTMYGMTPVGGGASHYGTIFSCNLDGSGYRILHAFAYAMDDGRFPAGSLTLSGTTLYGVTYHGGGDGESYLDRGTVFKIETDGSDFTVLHVFTGGFGAGEHPAGTLLLSGTTLYGMTEHGGGGTGVFSNCGTIFKIETDGSQFAVLHNFSGGVSDGREPWGSLLLSGTTLYGMTSYGGANDLGTVFRMESNGNGFTLLHTFGDGAGNGREPFGSLVLDGGTLFGMTKTGGVYGGGTIFRICADGSNFSLLHSFAAGASPLGSPSLRDGFLYGMTYGSGEHGSGSIFRISTAGGCLSLQHSFPGAPAGGAKPLGSLRLCGETFFGMTENGGSYDKGTIFAFRPPSVQFTSVPPYRSFEDLEGSAAGVVFDDYRVAVYIFVSGWWNKPYQDAPLTVINPDGTWVCDITTGGIDEYATRIAAFLVPKTFPPPVVSGEDALPDELYANAAAWVIHDRPVEYRLIQFAGYTWKVKAYGATVGPGPNYYSDREEDAWTDPDGRLHLRIAYRDSRWYCTEVINALPMGYGKYILRLDSPPDQLDPNVVLGFFTWDDAAPEQNYREIDIEFSRWCDPENLNTQFVIQPWNHPGNMYRFGFPAGIARSSHSLEWHESEVNFQSRNDSTGTPLGVWSYTGTDIPAAGGGNARINLWLVSGLAPVDGQETEIIIRSFSLEGDLNKDGQTGSADLPVLAKYLAGAPLPAGTSLTDCDLNADDVIDAADLCRLLVRIAQAN